MSNLCPLALRSLHFSEEVKLEAEYSVSETNLMRSAVQTQRREWLPTFNLGRKAVSCWRIAEDDVSQWGFEG